MIDTYRLFLGYELVDHGRVPPALAALWGKRRCGANPHSPGDATR